MNPFPKPETIDLEINNEVKRYIDNQLATQGKIMFYDVMELLEKAIEAKDKKRSTIIAWYITRSLLKSSMQATERDFLLLGMQEQINALEEGRDPETYNVC